ncbi:MAG: hypothetical protein NTY02_19690, partial [Acidobacteria bacterium]|nr:hypothetical protein [Acidobacteriota bacterium]
MPDLATCRRVVLGLCADGSVAAIRRRAVIVPSQAAAEQVRRSLEACAFGSGQLAVVVPHLLTRDEWMDRLEEGRAGSRGVVSRLEREVLLGVAARSAIDAGAVPPFTIRPGLVSEMLAFYDGLRRHMRSIDAFERVVVEELSRAVDSDRGAVRMLDQTRFLVAAFRDYEAPDFDLLTRLPGLNRLDVVATEAVLASGFEQRVRVWLPEIADVKETADGAAPPRLVAPPASETELFWRYRDREEELAATIRRIKRAGRLAPHVALSRTAV